MMKKKSKNRKFRTKSNSRRSLRRLANPSESEIIELGETIRTETKKNIIEMIYIVEGELMKEGNIPAAVILSLLRRQFTRGDIDQETLLYWLKVEGLA